MRWLWLCSLLVVVSVAGCQTAAGFKPPAAALLTLGVTTEADIRAQYGEPARVERSITPSATADAAAAAELSPFTAVPVEGTYAFLVYRLVDKPLFTADPKIKVASFMLWNGVLVDYSFVSNFEQDSSNFDETKLARLEKGVTIEAQAISLLGPPSGRGTFPAIRDPGFQVLHYLYYNVDVGFWAWDMDVENKRLDVLIDPKGRVVDYVFQSGGSPATRPRQ